MNGVTMAIFTEDDNDGENFGYERRRDVGEPYREEGNDGLEVILGTFPELVRGDWRREIVGMRALMSADVGAFRNLLVDVLFNTDDGFHFRIFDFLDDRRDGPFSNIEETAAFILAKNRKRAPDLAPEDNDWLETSAELEARLREEMSIQETEREVQARFRLAKELSIETRDPILLCFEDVRLRDE